MSEGYRVYFDPGSGFTDPLNQQARIFVVRTDPSGKQQLLVAKADVWEWKDLIEGASPPTGSLPFPAEAVPALYEALDKAKGAPSHARTEAAVLREWLDAERGRSDRLIDLAVSGPRVIDYEPGSRHLPPIFKDKS